MRRRTFAASVVVTLSLAEAGCDGASTPPSGDGTEQIAVNPPAPTPKLDVGSAEIPEPEPQPEPKPKPAEDIELQPDGTCVRYPHVECPEDPQITCNPPAPEVVPCPDSVYPKAMNAARVHERDDGTCWEDMGGDFKCPKGAMCNPPPPRRVQCPTE